MLSLDSQVLLARQCDWLIRAIAVEAYQFFVEEHGMKVDSLHEDRMETLSEALVHGVLRPAGADPERVTPEKTLRDAHKALKHAEDYSSLSLAYALGEEVRKELERLAKA